MIASLDYLSASFLVDVVATGRADQGTLQAEVLAVGCFCSMRGHRPDLAS